MSSPSRASRYGFSVPKTMTTEEMQATPYKRGTKVRPVSYTHLTLPTS